MLIKNLMEDKQLNFNQPLLSVRRFSSTVASDKADKKKADNSLPNIPPIPHYKSELKSGPVRNPGTVPFIWEQSPGRPKDESKPKTQTTERPPVGPKLPPGRILKAKQQNYDKVYEDPNVSKRQAGNVPYVSQGVSTSDGNVMKFESSKDEMEEEESSDSGNGDEAYLDALDALSQTESFFLNCSVSGLSGLDGPDVKPSGTFSTDPQTRDFMMGRFLPAAKAMASEAPSHAPRKPHVAWEQPRRVKKVVSGNERPPVYRYGHNIVPYSAQDSVEEESDEDYDETRKFPMKVCGLLPRFCLRSSFCLLNPVPGMSVRARAPVSPAIRTQARSSSTGSCSETENEHDKVVTCVQRSIGGPQTTELRENKCDLKDEPPQIAYQSNSQKLDGSSMYKRMQCSGMPPYRNESPQSPFCEKRGILEIPGEAKGNIGFDGLSAHRKDYSRFQELLADQSSNGEIDSTGPMVEKTLYVDSVHKVESPNSSSHSSDVKRTLYLRENDDEFLVKSKGMEEIPSVDSSLKDIGNLDAADGKAIVQSNIQKPVDLNLHSSADKSNHEMAIVVLKRSGQDHNPQQHSIISANLKAPEGMNPDFEDQQPPQTKIFGNSHGSYSEFPVPPPLPKSPSDSWLWRTLPSMSTRKPPLHSHLGAGINPRSQVCKTSFVGPKLGRAVNTTKEKHQHLRSSEEIMPPIPEI